MRRKIIYIFTICLAAATMQSCKYNELPPKTDDASSEYIIPKGVVPSAAEIEEQNAAKKEYNESIKKN